MTRGFRLPDREYLPAIFEHLDIGLEDQQEIRAAWPSAEMDPETWRSLERAYETLVQDLGGFAPLELAGAPAPSGAPTPGPAVNSTPLGRYFFVYVYLGALADVRRFHAKRGISDEISWATLSDLGRNLRRDRLLLGDGGLRTSGWLTLHFRGALYQLGRLQFNRTSVRAAHVADAFREGEPALGIHIPESGPLAPLACDDSLGRAGSFFARHFPETPTRVAICTLGYSTRSSRNTSAPSRTSCVSSDDSHWSATAMTATRMSCASCSTASRRTSTTFRSARRSSARSWLSCAQESTGGIGPAG